METQIKKSQVVLKSEKKNIFEKMEQRYGFKLDYSVLICEDRLFGENGISDSISYKFTMMHPKEVLRRLVVSFDATNKCISSLDELYQLTNSGMYSKKHPINKMIKNGEPYVSLIPIILISSKRTTYSFRVDNNIIGDFFRDTESINNGKYGKDKSVSLDRRFLEQKEFLEYFYPDSKSSLSPELWLSIYQEKIQNGKGGLLHSEYLQLKSTNLN